jgi:Mg2+-importing ATPase
VYKSSQAKEHEGMFDAPNLLISDTKIIQGKVLGLVLNIGEETYANKIISFSEEANDETDYEIGLKKVTKIILILILAFFPIIFGIS